MAINSKVPHAVISDVKDMFMLSLSINKIEFLHKRCDYYFRGVYEISRSIRDPGSTHLINEPKLELKCRARLVNELSLSTLESS